MNAIMLRRCGAEFFGTFAYVFFGCGARIMVGSSQDAPNRLLVYFTFGFALFAMTYALSHISAAPFNPAATLGLAIARRFSWKFVLPYWIAQVAGATAASATHLLLFPKRARAVQFGATIPTVGIWQAITIEAIITFFLMFVFMAATTDRRVNQAVVGLATGFMITIGGLFAGPLTGGSMNSARSLGPAILAGGAALSTAWIYWVGPMLGAALGALAFELLRGGQEYALQVPRGAFSKLENSEDARGEDDRKDE